MKGKRIFIFLVLQIAVLLLISAYILTAAYYRERFALNTWIQGIYCTGRTVDEINAELLSDVKAPHIVIEDENGDYLEFSMEEMDFRADYTKALTEILDSQTELLWPDRLGKQEYLTCSPGFSFSEDKLRVVFDALTPIQEEKQREKANYIQKTAEGAYGLYDGLTDRIHIENSWELFLAAVHLGVDELESSYSVSSESRRIELDATSVFVTYDIPKDEAAKETEALWEKISYLYNCDIVYDMGTERIPMTPEILSGFLKEEAGLPLLDENAELILDKNAVTSFVDQLGDRYDTFKLERDFVTVSGETKTLKGKNYGTRLDRKAEVQFLMNNLLTAEMHTGVKKEHLPSYEREAYVRGLNDIGDTYVEIDMSCQKLYFWVDGEIKVETDIVTGNKRRGWNTPEGVCKIYSKQRNRVLRGQGYASRVKYWMPINGNIGLHDASWRDEFGGTIYERDGSHGCINIPPGIMPEIYELAEVGMPVILYN